MKWHNNPGLFSDRVGFRMLEFSQLLFEYIRPWWTVAKQNPEERLPYTIAYLEKHFEEGENS